MSIFHCFPASEWSLQMKINHHHLRAAQSKAAIAAFLSDGAMWMEAHRLIKNALGLPWYRPNR